MPTAESLAPEQGSHQALLPVRLEPRPRDDDFAGTEVVAHPEPKRTPSAVWYPTTALVVGPLGSEIHVDALGQIKVQFHWDRDGKNDDNSSCWIRTVITRAASTAASAVNRCLDASLRGST